MSRLFAPSFGRAGSMPVACCALAGLAIPFWSLSAGAAVEVRGTSASVHVVAHYAKVSEELRALTESLQGFNCREITNLDGVISGRSVSPD